MLSASLSSSFIHSRKYEGELVCFLEAPDKGMVGLVLYVLIFWSTWAFHFGSLTSSASCIFRKPTRNVLGTGNLGSSESSLALDTSDRNRQTAS